jgi:hypothetical protein
MRVAIDLEQPRDLEVSVLLRGAERAVAEELLDRAQVGALLEEMGGEGVAQGVRVHAALDRGRLRPSDRGCGAPSDR